MLTSSLREAKTKPRNYFVYFSNFVFEAIASIVLHILLWSILSELTAEKSSLSNLDCMNLLVFRLYW